MYPMMGGGTQKIEMNKRTRSAMPSKEYEAMKTSMLRQAEMSGMQRVSDDIRLEGAGSALEAARDPKYGNVNMPGLSQGMMQGTESMGYESFDNAPLAQPSAQTGLLGSFSVTQQPQKQPELMGQEAQAGIRQRVLGEQGGLNNRQALYRMGG